MLDESTDDSVDLLREKLMEKADSLAAGFFNIGVGEEFHHIPIRRELRAIMDSLIYATPLRKWPRSRGRKPGVQWEGTET